MFQQPANAAKKRSLLLLIGCGFLTCAIGHASAATSTANGAIPPSTAQAAQTARASAIGTMGMGAGQQVKPPDGIDFRATSGQQTPHLPFNVQGQQMMDLTPTGLGINVGVTASDPTGPTEALDVAGYVRVRSVNGEGGVLYLDGAASGQKIWMENNQGTFRLMNDGWTQNLMTVNQNGDAAFTGNIYSNGEVQATKQVRVIGPAGGAGAVLYNDGTTTSLQFTAAGDPTGSANGALALAVDNASGIVKFPNSVAVQSGGVAFPDGSVQTSASNYGGEYSMIQPYGGGTANCSAPNYRTNGCSCPASQSNAYQFVNFPGASGILQVFVCSSDNAGSGAAAASPASPTSLSTSSPATSGGSDGGGDSGAAAPSATAVSTNDN